MRNKAILMAVFAAALLSQTAAPERIGKQADGSVLLPTGQRIHPEGTQIALDTFPMSSALSPDGKFLLVLNGGFKPPSISVLSLAPVKEIARVPVADAWLGIAFAPNGRTVYVSGGSRARVFEFTFSPQGELKPAREFEVAAQRTPRDFIGDVAVSPDGRLVYAADLYKESVVVINPQSGRVIERFPTGRRPYRVVFHPDGKSFYVSSWADGTVYVYETANGRERGRIRLGPHTTDMVFSDRKLEEDDDKPPRYRLFVTGANTNSVFVVGVSENGSMKLWETLNVAFTPRQPLGMTPSALALSPDQTRLLITCSDANVVAVADVSEAHSFLLGHVAAGWYPTASRELPDGRMIVLNGRGTPGAGAAGSVSIFDALTDESIDNFTQAARALSAFKDSDLEARAMWPVDHVIYIVKDGRGYDEVLGKIGKGNSDPSLTVFDESVAPNHYKLAREFVLFDNFYVNGEASADGHNWVTAGIVPDYTQRLWPNSYAGRRDAYDYEGGEPANTPPAGYLWSNALQAGIPVRNYGYFATNLEKPGANGVQISSVRDPSLQAVTNMRYRGFDPDYADVERAHAFLDDLKQFEMSGNMPRLMILRLGNDQTAGTAAGKLTPRAMVADNDAALGMIVEGVSRSRFWEKTAIFVVEADARDTRDHVDSHRSLLLTLSPYTRRGAVDSTMYNQSSVLRTVEQILGMRPLTHFDASARALTGAFSSTARAEPYTAEKPRISLTERNP